MNKFKQYILSIGLIILGLIVFNYNKPEVTSTEVPDWITYKTIGSLMIITGVIIALCKILNKKQA